MQGVWVFRPRFLAAAMPSRVRSEINRRSKCAMAPKTWNTSSPAADEVSRRPEPGHRRDRVLERFVHGQSVSGGVDPRINGEQRVAGTTRCRAGRQDAASRQASSRLLRCAPALRVTRRNVLTHRVFMAGSELPATSRPICENTCPQKSTPISCVRHFSAVSHSHQQQSHRPPATAGPAAGAEPAQARLAVGLGSHRPDRRLRLELRRRATHHRATPQSLSDEDPRVDPPRRMLNVILGTNLPMTPCRRFRVRSPARGRLPSATDLWPADA